jgi:hypothetical protein
MHTGTELLGHREPLLVGVDVVDLRAVRHSECRGV